MEDQTIIYTDNKPEDNVVNDQINPADKQYINDCVKEVCIKDDALSKYQKFIEKKFDADFYQKCNVFIEEMKETIKKKKNITNSSVIKLKYMANTIFVTEETVDAVIDHFKNKQNIFVRFFVGLAYLMLLGFWCFLWFVFYIVSPNNKNKIAKKINSIVD